MFKPIDYKNKASDVLLFLRVIFLIFTDNFNFNDITFDLIMGYSTMCILSRGLHREELILKEDIFVTNGHRR